MIKGVAVLLESAMSSLSCKNIETTYPTIYLKQEFEDDEIICDEFTHSTIEIVI